MRRSTMCVSDGAFFAIALCFVAAVAGWITHLFWVISLLMNNDSIGVGKVMLALAGAFFPPFGALHGVWLWFH
jgi:hypothetical protein